MASDGPFVVPLEEVEHAPPSQHVLWASVCYAVPPHHDHRGRKVLIEAATARLGEDVVLEKRLLLHNLEVPTIDSLLLSCGTSREMLLNASVCGSNRCLQ